VWTNENLPAAPGAVSVVGDPKSKAKPASSKPASDVYVASVRKQLEKLQQDIAIVDKQLVDLKNFNAGEPSTSASGTKLNKDHDREPIEVQIRALGEKRKELESQLAALVDEARKKGIEPGQLR
jgi:chromosome segregation ATPase